MKISLALGPRRPLSRQTAWGCFTTNLALPGFGSLLAGRASGYPQAALAVAGTILTLVFGTRGIVWIIGHYSALMNAEGDPLANLVQMWGALRWALLGILLFVAALLWALGTGLAILREAREEPENTPPKLGSV